MEFNSQGSNDSDDGIFGKMFRLKHSASAMKVELLGSIFICLNRMDPSWDELELSMGSRL